MIQPAEVVLSSDGIPFSAVFDDVYHTADGGLGQALHVFLAGNGLPQRWQGRDAFTILETGFGLGLNFLVTWQAWRCDPLRSRRLHFISVEKFPFLPQDLQRLHAAWPQFSSLSADLVKAWPPLSGGRHDLFLDEGSVQLTLLLGDAREQFPLLEAQADAVYLDGFAPSKNPDMWSLPIFEQLYRLAVPGCTLATWSVAGMVRNGLKQAGFAVCKTQGFGGKRQMLKGYREKS
ncbi:tRNA U34 5-methylaminomethyl-2-thiouridine-forming methyltransferase MnmC [Formivibrio citricus]|uniref:tRNA U34 5-methylaminomethyl-2-thiouridine-forming methyltransferase MnmC n=1 Tax=Formivibrio citricus TaxID=83765 RepID=A0A1I4Y5F7_9NEIS|nr:tRNA (5-methylaminomethyl-2-thiouridine)(34)-methyltransferase MnmD [Formivibrio citricus]SFN33257.1 tRNA U34 5-methylaminomethyl-2-thiouridine-forming methyltransferase MnmC [Formivibrio citricus]